MKKILESVIIQQYRKYGWAYNVIKGHTGVDLWYKFEELPTPVTGKVIAITTQKEMGKCIYVQDVNKNVHVFAHMSKIDVHVDQEVDRQKYTILGVTGNTGSVTSGPHLHYEIITKRPVNKIDWIMSRSLNGIKGFNTHPILYLQALYKKYNVEGF